MLRNTAIRNIGNHYLFRPYVTSAILENVKPGNLEPGKNILTTAEAQKFKEYLPEIISDLTTLPRFANLNDTNNWISQILHQLLRHGSHLRAYQSILACKYLSPAHSILDSNLIIANAWCLEIKEQGREIVEDMVDGTAVKNGKETWHCANNHGLAAICDAILLMSGTKQLYEKYFKSSKYYKDLTNLFGSSTHAGLYGKSLALRGQQQKLFESYTMKRYSQIKSCVDSTFYTPLATAMIITGHGNPGNLKEVQAVTNLLSQLWGARNDLFGPASWPEKPLVDIENGVCTWQFSMAMEQASKDYKKILIENYGSKEPLKTEAIMDIYEKMDIHGRHAQWKEKMERDISELLGTVELDGLRSYFDHISYAFFNDN